MMTAFWLLLVVLARSTVIASNVFNEISTNTTLFQSIPLGDSSSISNLIERRQMRRCVDPGYVPCPNANGCCPPSYICQPGNPHAGPKGSCCPSFANGCGGAACCSPGTTCCGSTCCGAGSRCSGGRCVTLNTQTTTSTSRRPTFTIPSTTLSTSTSSGSRASSLTSCPLSGRDLNGRQVENCPTATKSVAQSSRPSPPVETRIPIEKPMIFDYPRLRTKKKGESAAKAAARQEAVDQLFKSMCKGLLSRGQVNDAIFTFTDDKQVKKDNRVNAGCVGSPCNTAQTGTSCDEFPFASTTDGGVGAVFSCIAQLAQNIQGGVISSFKQKNSLQSGQHYTLKIEGYDCATNRPTTIVSAALPANITSDSSSIKPLGEEEGITPFRRDLIPGGSETGELESFPPFTADDTNNTIIHSIGDIPAGTYTINTLITQGSVSSLRVINYIGDEYARANVVLNDNGRQALTFTLDSDGVGLGFFMDTQLDTVNISSTMQIGAANLNSAVPKFTGILLTTLIAVMGTAML